MLRLLSPAFVVAFFLSVPAWAAEVTRYDRFKLWNDCRPMRLVIENLRKDAGDIGLTEEKIARAARSRLRTAHLYDVDAVPGLYVNVNVVGRAFSIDVGYVKLILDHASGENGWAKTWETGSAGTHGQDSSYILSSVSQQMDEFIDEYLRINEEACKN